MSYSVYYTTEPNHNELKILNQGLAEHAEQQKNLEPIEAFAYFVKDEGKKIIAGIIGSLMYGSMHIDTLYVEKNLRQQGIGKILMEKAQMLAQEKQCDFITVNTFDWEAKDFYCRLEFEVEFQRDGYQNDSVFYFLKKDL